MKQNTGDIVTPKEIEYEMKLMFEDRKIEILAYNIETLLVEKLKYSCNTRHS